MEGCFLGEVLTSQILQYYHQGGGHWSYAYTGSPIFQISDLKLLRSDLERDLRDCKAVIDRVSAILY